MSKFIIAIPRGRIIKELKPILQKTSFAPENAMFDDKSKSKFSGGFSMIILPKFLSDINALSSLCFETFFLISSNYCLNKFIVYRYKG